MASALAEWAGKLPYSAQVVTSAQPGSQCSQALDEEQWVTTDAAIALVRDSSGAWAELHRGIGAEASAAQNAAKNTANFYLGLG